MIDKFIRNKDDTKQCLYIIRDYRTGSENQNLNFYLSDSNESILPAHSC